MLGLSKTQKEDLEKLLHQACVLRDGNKCLKCHKTKTLQASHIYPKGRYQKMRYVLDNVKTLCYACHMHFWHKNPIEANEWLRTVVSAERLEKLKLMSQYVDKTPFDYNLTKIFLEQKIQEYERPE